MAATLSLGQSVVRSVGAHLGVPVAATLGREIATVWVSWQLRGGFNWGGAGLGVVAGRAGAGQGSACARQAAFWPPAHVNLLKCMHSNRISYYRDTISRVCPGIGLRVLLRVL